MDCLLFNIVFCYMNCICIAKTSHQQLTKLLLKKKKKKVDCMCRTKLGPEEMADGLES